MRTGYEDAVTLARYQTLEADVKHNREWSVAGASRQTHRSWWARAEGGSGCRRSDDGGPVRVDEDFPPEGTQVGELAANEGFGAAATVEVVKSEPLEGGFVAREEGPAGDEDRVADSLARSSLASTGGDTAILRGEVLRSNYVQAGCRST